LKFDLAIAGAEDDGPIRRLLSENPMPGAVTVAFEREPDFFRGQQIMGDRCQTFKAVERASGRLAGIVSVASSKRWINGEVRSVGYVGGVRIAKEFQGKMLPLRAFPFIRERAGQGWPGLWFGAIVHGNPTARALFVDLPRTSFPRPEEVSQIHTLAILTRKQEQGRRAANHGPTVEQSYTPRSSGRVGIVRGTQASRESIVSFLNETGRRREFFPVVSRNHFAEESRPPYPAPGDFLAALIDGEIAGVCAVWDQSDFKQTVVHGYSGWLARAKPLINASGPIAGMKRLPEIGDEISSAYLSFLAVQNDDPVVFRELLKAAVADAYSRGKDYLMTGFSIRDPLLKIAKKCRHILYRSTMYAFSFDGPLTEDAFDRRKIPYLEGATL
jgi:hypothetical protein